MNNFHFVAESLHVFWAFFDQLSWQNGRRANEDGNALYFAELFSGNKTDKEIGDAFSDVFENRRDISDETINLYPSEEKGECRERAVFVALDSKAFGLKRRHTLSFKDALTAIVQHVQGSCHKTTRSVLLITSSWNQEELEPWLDNIRNFNLDRFDILVRSGKGWTVIDGRQLNP